MNQYDSRQEPCDMVSHPCHIEYDNVSHDRSCWTCKHFEYEDRDYSSPTMFCHHDDMRTSLQLPLRDCKLYGETNGELSG